jgi:hypothetical protein
MIRYLRIFAVLVLAVAAVATATCIFAFIRDSQRSHFESNFARIAETILTSLNQDLSHHLFSGRTMAAAMTVALQLANQSHLSLAIPPDSFEILFSSAVASTRSPYVSWNPLIRTDDERRLFEDMATRQEKNGFFNIESHPPCYVCGSSNAQPSKMDVQVKIPAVGAYRCSQLDGAGRAGIIPSDSCMIVSEEVQTYCACSQSEEGDPEPIEEPPQERIFRNVSKGLFRYEANRTIVDEPWSGGPYLPMWQDRLAYARAEPLLFNHLSNSKLSEAVSKMLFSGQWQISEFIYRQDPTFYGQFIRSCLGPMSVLYFPVKTPDRTEIVGAISMVVDWTNLHTAKAPLNGDLVDIVVDGSCGETSISSHTYGIASNGNLLNWKGEGDQHDPTFSRLVVQSSFDEFELFGQPVGERSSDDVPFQGQCQYRYVFII